MTITSSDIYAGETPRTIVVDRSLNNANKIETVKEQLNIPSFAEESIYLPTEMLGVTISWSSSNPLVISSTGIVTQKNSRQTVTLTAHLSNDGVSDTKTFIVTVPAKVGELDTDNDGIPDSEDEDDDNDGYKDGVDDFPLNASEWLDTDGDGTGNNADRDDDNDGISDVDEIKWGFDPLDASDGGNADADGDGVSNADEIEAGSDPFDPDDTKKPKRFVPIMMDDIVTFVPLKD